MSFTTLTIAWRNLWRNRTRTSIALGAIALAQLFVVSMGGLMAGMFQDMFDALTGPFVGHVRITTRDWPRERDKAEQTLEASVRDAQADALRTVAREAAVIEARANVLMFDELLDDAGAAYAAAGELYRQAEDRTGIARTLARLARIAVRGGDLDAARLLFARARGEYLAVDDARGAALMSSFAEDPSSIDRPIPERIGDVGALTERLRSIEGVTAVSPRITTSVLAFKANDTVAAADAETAMVVGIDMELETVVNGLVGEYGSGPLPAEGSVVVGRGLAQRLGVAAGDTLAVIGQRVDASPVDALYTVARVLRSPVTEIDGNGIVMAIADVRALLTAGDTAHEIVVRTADHRTADALAARIRTFPDLVDALVQPWNEASPEIATILEMKGKTDGIFVLILFVAAAAGIANTMMMSTYERTREFGMLLGVGSRPGRIMSMVLAESVVLGALGVAIGSALGVGLVWLTSHTGIDYAAMTGVSDKGTDFDYLGLNFSMVIYPKLEWGYVTSGLVAVSLTSLVATLLPAWSASRLEPMEAMRS